MKTYARYHSIGVIKVPRRTMIEVIRVTRTSNISRALQCGESRVATTMKQYKDDSKV
jgi:hypothetical protein